MKTIGLIGGMSWESSLEYYRIINETVRERMGGHHSCDCLMYSVDFGIIEKLQHEGRWDELTRIMVEAALRLEQGGAEFIVICTNTMHRMATDIEFACRIPLLHIADATAEKILAQGLKKVALLGTRFTMEQDFYKVRIREKHGIEVLVPSPRDMETVHRVIYDELVMGNIRIESKNSYLEIIKRLADNGAEGVILGCTEIPLLVRQEDCAVPVFDTTRIHAEAAVDRAIGETRDAIGEK